MIRLSSLVWLLCNLARRPFSLDQISLLSDCAPPDFRVVPLACPKGGAPMVQPPRLSSFLLKIFGFLGCNRSCPPTPVAGNAQTVFYIFRPIRANKFLH